MMIVIIIAVILVSISIGVSVYFATKTTPKTTTTTLGPLGPLNSYSPTTTLRPTTTTLRPTTTTSGPTTTTTSGPTTTTSGPTTTTLRPTTTSGPTTTTLGPTTTTLGPTCVSKGFGVYTKDFPTTCSNQGVTGFVRERCTATGDWVTEDYCDYPNNVKLIDISGTWDMDYERAKGTAVITRFANTNKKWQVTTTGVTWNNADIVSPSVIEHTSNGYMWMRYNRNGDSLRASIAKFNDAPTSYAKLTASDFYLVKR